MRITLVCICPTFQTDRDNMGREIRGIPDCEAPSYWIVFLTFSESSYKDTQKIILNWTIGKHEADSWETHKLDVQT